ncbi:sigma factor-like helix-turn-helix DNA-binding protein [Enterococcus avium]|uniref:Sigma factor-like helix-turn-helix DNA-binding protein n=1 Tax=Enterococcus avium TaxID=33945 RepID=A0ABD5F564_ENTAV|nr:sigma factor-like helix-turn-helix DNA-binding protein [Enterococcus avium]MDT2484132.1 sigma factor-like helix-turn-helix DNA-binding protein [Enterococcus avium]MDT2510678.1 sigma factor-like helix-turn-helix DNA-binding protein [Enterococcus avium]MDT2513361.1 sigma factor-like helix-turn-helix DNA-binding protein [Enterococcus avium]
MFKRDEDLILEYKTSLRNLRASHRAIEKKKYTVKVKDHGQEIEKKIDDRTAADINDQTVLSSMISECEYTLFWLEHGYEKPYTDEDFKRLSKSKREQLWANIDDAVDYYGVSVTTDDQPSSGNQEQYEQLMEILSTLSPRELELFKMRHEAMLTEKECAEKMEISLGAIKCMSQRIRDKIEDYFAYGHQIELF